MSDVERNKRIEEYRKISLEADYLAYSGKEDQSVKLLKLWHENAKENGDRDYELFFQAEVIHYSEPDYNKQIALLEEAFGWIEEKGLGSDFFLLRTQGVYHSFKGDWDLAIEWYDKALTENPHDHNTMRNKGITLSKKGELDLSLEWYDKVLAENPHNYKAMRQKGVLLSKKGELDLALEWYDKALAENPHDHHAMRDKGVSLNNKGELDLAIEWYDKALEENPHDHDAMRNKGLALIKKGNESSAMEFMDKALKVNPKDSTAMIYKGTLLAKKGERKLAIGLYKEAQKVKPEDALLYREWAATEYNFGKIENSFGWICEAVKRDPIAHKDDFSFVCGAMGKDFEGEWLKLFPDGEQQREETPKSQTTSQISELKGFIANFREAYPQAQDFIDYQKKEEEKREKFLLPKTLIVKKESLLLTLRRWNSFTPAVPTGEQERSIGGGYFLRHGGMGIVIDPGYHFIENFDLAGGRIYDVDAVVLTHAHNDHTIEFETLLTLIHEYNENLEELQEDDKFTDCKPKKIDVYMNNGSFMKFSGLLNLRGNSSVRHIYTLNGGNKYELDKDKIILLEVVEAYHDEVVAKEQSVGLIFDLKGDGFDRRVVFTSDTGLLPLDPDEEKPTALNDYDREVWKAYGADEKRPDVMVVHIGSIKSQELDGKFVEPDEACYPNHLGILGTTRVITQCMPKFAIVSEFGEEMKSFRCDLVRGLEEKVIKPFLKKAPEGETCEDLRVVPGDVALFYDLKEEEFYNCVTSQWDSYKSIDYALDSKKSAKKNGIYYFSIGSRKRFIDNRPHHAEILNKDLKKRLNVYFE